MQTKLLNAAGVARELVRLFSEHSKINIAVAWAVMNEPVKILLSNKRKFESVIIGTDFAATDWRVIKKLVNVDNAYVAGASNGCFHPKIYYFETEDLAEAIVGSANLTPGGLGTNHEACLLLSGMKSEKIFCDLRRQLGRYSHLRREITPELAKSYELQAKAAAAGPRPPRPQLPGDGKAWKQMNSPLVSMEWREFVREARRDPFHDFDKRMALLRRAQSLLAAAGSFSELAAAEWKAIAGVIGDSEKPHAGSENLEWGWFGSMGGAGVFAGRIGSQDRDLASAMDSIPRHGLVSRSRFDRFRENFARAFDGEKRVGRVATASRLLAMKRPDSFVCVNKGNKVGIAKALAFAPTTLSLDNYWERIVEPLRASLWYNETEPSSRDRELWEYRAAMLDAIYYAPEE